MVNTNPLFDVTDRGAHVLIALIWAVALVGINYIEITGFPPLIPAMGVGTFVLFIVCQDIGIAIANAYFQVNVEMTASGIKENSTGQPLDNATLTAQVAALQTQLKSITGTTTTPAASATST